MALAAPHIRMERVGIKSVAVGFLLCVYHYLFKILSEEEGVLSAADHLVFKEEARVDVNDYLSAILKLTFDKLYLFLALGLCDSVYP